MSEVFNLTGTITNEHTIHLDQPFTSASGPVRLVVEVPAKSQEPRESIQEFLAKIQAAQKARGHVPRTVEEIIAYINEERDSWERG